MSRVEHTDNRQRSCGWFALRTALPHLTAAVSALWTRFIVLACRTPASVYYGESSPSSMTLLTTTTHIGFGVGIGGVAHAPFSASGFSLSYAIRVSVWTCLDSGDRDYLLSKD